MLYIPIPDQLKHLGEEYNHCGIITVDSFGWEIIGGIESIATTSIHLCCDEQKKY